MRQKASFSSPGAEAMRYLTIFILVFAAAAVCVAEVRGTFREFEGSVFVSIVDTSTGKIGSYLLTGHDREWALIVAVHAEE